MPSENVQTSEENDTGADEPAVEENVQEAEADSPDSKDAEPEEASAEGSTENPAETDEPEGAIEDISAPVDAAVEEISVAEATLGSDGASEPDETVEPIMDEGEVAEDIEEKEDDQALEDVENNNITLYECLDLNEEPEDLDQWNEWKCGSCGEFV